MNCCFMSLKRCSGKIFFSPVDRVFFRTAPAFALGAVRVNALRLFSLFVLAFILLLGCGVATPLLIALALTLTLSLAFTLSLALTLSGLLTLFLLLRALTLVFFVCHV